MKYIILSVNSDPQYLQYIPLTAWSWKRIGWDPIILYYGDHETPLFDLVAKNTQLISFWWINPIKGYRSDTITQVSRLYAACKLQDDDLIITGDADMLALTDYWRPDPSKLTIYGHDLTNRGEVPVCYVSATAKNWRQLMNIDSTDVNALIKRDLKAWPNAGENIQWENRWSADQQILTDRINHSNLPKQYVDRGTLPTGYAKRRIDRGNWTYDVLRANDFEFIDCHQHRDLYTAFRDEHHQYRYKWEQHRDMIHMLWPKENFDWYYQFMEKFSKLVR